jgi:hypothetical protein
VEDTPLCAPGVLAGLKQIERFADISPVPVLGIAGRRRKNASAAKWNTQP